MPDGSVKYAYKSNKLENGATASAVREANKQNLIVVEEDLSQRTSHSRTFKTSDPNVFITEVISGVPAYYKDSNGEWWETEYATTTKEAFDAQTISLLDKIFPKVYAVDFYPSSSTEDGAVAVDAGNPTWAASHDASSGDYAQTDTANFNCGQTQYHVGDGYIIHRAIFLFDTSSIPSENTIASATLEVYQNQNASDGDNDGLDYLVLASSSPASNTSFVYDDYDQFGNTELSDRIDLSTRTSAANSWATFTLNSSGLAAIAKGSSAVTKLGSREGHDITDTAITESEAVNAFNMNYSESASNKPTLTVIHYGPIETHQSSISRKEADESITSSTNLQDVLSVAAEANKKYIIEGVVFATSTSADPGIKIAFTAPSGVTMDLGYIASSVTSLTTVGELLETPGSASTGIPLAANAPVVIKISGTMEVGGTGGALTLQWAQNNSDSAAVTLKEGSYLKAEEI